MPCCGVTPVGVDPPRPLRSARLLAALVIAGCGTGGCRTAGRASSAGPGASVDVSAASAASASSLPPAPAWLAEADRVYRAALAAPPPTRPPFGRVRAALTIVEDDPGRDGGGLADCGAAATSQERKRRCTLEGRIDVRAVSRDGGISILPQCSVLAPDAILGPGERHGPWQIASGALAAGSTAILRGSGGSTWTLHVERWTEPGPLPPRARDAWLYTRSLVVAHARSFGIALDVEGSTRECPGEATPAERDACHATCGSPLAMLMDPEVPIPMNGEPDPMARAPGFWVRERVLAPVRRGEIGGFIGRAPRDEVRVTCAQIETRMRPFADALLAHGLDLARFAMGAVLTDGDLYYPQVSLPRLAGVLECLGLARRVAPALGELAAMPSLDWQNRFRAGCVSRLLAGRACDLDLLREALGADAVDGGPLDDLDLRCIEGLMGGSVLGG
jgi:hypothetical protein